MCPHVYQKSDTDTCSLCGKETHRVDWEYNNQLHRQWIADGKADWNKCPQGGTLRGWWSI